MGSVAYLKLRKIVNAHVTIAEYEYYISSGKIEGHFPN